MGRKLETPRRGFGHDASITSLWPGSRCADQRARGLVWSYCMVKSSAFHFAGVPISTFTMKPPKVKPTPSSSPVNIIECRHSGRGHHRIFYFGLNWEYYTWLFSSPIILSRKMVFLFLDPGGLPLRLFLNAGSGDTIRGSDESLDEWPPSLPDGDGDGDTMGQFHQSCRGGGISILKGWRLSTWLYSSPASLVRLHNGSLLRLSSERLVEVEHGVSRLGDGIEVSTRG